MMVITTWVINLAPVGVFFLIGGQVNVYDLHPASASIYEFTLTKRSLHSRFSRSLRFFHISIAYLTLCIPLSGQGAIYDFGGGFYCLSHFMQSLERTTFNLGFWRESVMSILLESNFLQKLTIHGCNSPSETQKFPSLFIFSMT